MSRILAALVVASLVLAGCARTAPQENLLIFVNPLCTTCEDFIRCEATPGNAAVYDPTFDIYHLKNKTFLAQIATIWTFLVQSVAPKTEDERPIDTYRQRPGQGRKVIPGGVALTDLVKHRVQLPDTWIDQVDGTWHAADDSVLGSCKLVERADGRAQVATFKAGAGQ